MADTQKNEIVLRRLEKLLTMRVKFLNIDVYQGGFVKISDLVTKAPIFERFTITEESLKTLLAAKPELSAQYTVQGGYIKKNEGHSFDVNAAELPALPVS